MSAISFTSFDDSINDSDYAKPLSPTEVSDFENMSEYETLLGIQHNEYPDNTYYEYDDEVRVIENSDEEDTVIVGKKNFKYFELET